MHIFFGVSSVFLGHRVRLILMPPQGQADIELLLKKPNQGVKLEFMVMCCSKLFKM